MSNDINDSFLTTITEMVRSTLDEFDIQPIQHIPAKQTSYHEAGHAFLGLYHHIPPFEASIIRDLEKGSLGHVIPGYVKCTAVDYLGVSRIECFEDPETYYNLMGIEEERYDGALVRFSGTVSGTIAESLYSGAIIVEGVGQDMQDQGSAAIDYGIEVISYEIVSMVVNYTTSVLKKNWEHVENIAEDLYSKKVLKEEYFREYASMNRHGFVEVDQPKVL